MKRLLFVGGLVVIATLAALHTMRIDSQSAAAVPRPAATGPPTAIFSLGRLEPKGALIHVTAPSGNEGVRLDTLSVAEGQRVAAQQLLGRMDNHERLQAALHEASARLAAAEARLSQVKAGCKPGDLEAERSSVASAEFDLQIKQRHFERAKRLTDSNSISNAEADDIRLAYGKSQVALRHAKARLAAIAEIREVDVRVAEAEVALCRCALATAYANLNATEIRAPSDGTILRIHTRPGERVAQSGIVEMGEVRQMQAVAEIFEGDLMHIEVGDLAVVTVEGTGDEIKGSVAEIGHVVARKAVLTNDPVSDTDARVVEVRIDLDASSRPRIARLSNARVRVRIDVSSPRS